MSADLSSRNPTGTALRMADALLRSLGGTSVALRLAGAPGDGSDGAQIGLNTQTFQDLPLGPALFRKVHVTAQEGQPTKYEMLLSASSVESQVSDLNLASADDLFTTAMGVMAAGRFYLIESVASPEAFGQVYLYRLLLREAQPQSM